MREVTSFAVLTAGAEYHLPGDFPDLHAALEALFPGDTLVLGEGVYTVAWPSSGGGGGDPGDSSRGSCGTGAAAALVWLVLVRRASRRRVRL